LLEIKNIFNKYIINHSNKAEILEINLDYSKKLIEAIINYLYNDFFYLHSLDYDDYIDLYDISLLFNFEKIQKELDLFFKHINSSKIKL
jgi:hypothetical protein